MSLVRDDARVVIGSMPGVLRCLWRELAPRRMSWASRGEVLVHCVPRRRRAAHDGRARAPRSWHLRLPRAACSPSWLGACAMVVMGAARMLNRPQPSRPLQGRLRRLDDGAGGGGRALDLRRRHGPQVGVVSQAARATPDCR